MRALAGRNPALPNDFDCGPVDQFVGGQMRAGPVGRQDLAGEDAQFVINLVQQAVVVGGGQFGHAQFGGRV